MVSDAVGVRGRRVVLDVALCASRMVGGVDLSDEPEGHVDAGRDTLAAHDVAVHGPPLIANDGAVSACFEGVFEAPVGAEASVAARAGFVEQE